MNLYLPWTTTQEKSMSRNNSPDRTVRLNTALNTALILNELNRTRSDIRKTNAITIHNKHKQTQTQWNTIKQNW